MTFNKKPLVLIVDDVPKNLQVLGSILREEDLNIAVATNGLQALKVVENVLPDLILLDVMMPELNGFETCKRLKADSRTREIPVIFLTAKIETEDVIQGLQIGAVDYVTKPFNASELLTRVRTHLDLKLSREALKEANATKDKFFSIIAHDLRAPFSTLIGFSEYLIEDFDKMADGTKKEIVTDILAVSKQSYQLFENLLAWARSQTGSMEFHPELYDLRSVVEPVVMLQQERAKGKGINLGYEIPDKTMIKFDKNMIETVIRNLISNALKFTPGGGTITVSVQKIEDHHQITVADTGVGMTEEIRNKLFHAGEHVTMLGTEQEEGSGLGLLLCAEFIEKHAGKIRVESESGQGSKFHFTLPKSDA